MIRINLLPHRQIKRAERQREFNLMLVGTLILGVVIVFMVQTFIGANIDSQVNRNTRLEQANTQLDQQIAEIKELKNEISAVLERKQVVENLQTNRSQTVMVLDELSRELPEGMFLKSIKQQGSVITIEGIADTNARVAALVRNLSSSPAMESPSLVEIKSATVNGMKQNDFIMNVNIKIRQPDSADEPKGKIS
ncbi:MULTISPECIES: PilN domain-containing protein [Methylovorus]|jgi:type IV pilus assembly protein PilN|uniref:Fimbrial assembly family protein n=1 Tax=Methylovorus glucosotrophus (strain SIP3-4) TaxID=582744 RepID=C6XAX2_METGS|nr:MULTISPECIES: PilN domain-containing protein [Methylovorus]ACT51742.1 Fimbrial assembly family protein [Methylovorus glucosotrophus SIP3-4]ADQ85594.1 Fimbrial assembly family protein [Methylovorus sp. MP688]